MKKPLSELLKSPRRAAKKPAEKKKEAAPAQKGMKKQYLRSGECKVTFTLPAEAAFDAEGVSLVGDFNHWDPDANPMKRMKDGSFAATLRLEGGKDYCFKYLINNSRWENDWAADRYVPGPYMTDNSVVCLCGAH